MKVLKFHGEKDEDYLRLTFKGVFDPRAARETELEPFFHALEAHADGWMPDAAEGKRRRKYARAALWKALEEGRDGSHTSLGLYRTQWPALDMTLWL
ncbi:hypothetical protein ATI61_111229 [Archangium gephyra]|uniref:Uncharacterized protein n=1 Tax=Archangium gephyra TaxID=48 RepID=A0AAC8TIH3_9BACT|nr:Hypothetical protein AA314_08899 [Archangium gephyra]REG26679.1 hypothetical protein ATI61_111229 [Archangium gephyra]